MSIPAEKRFVVVNNINKDEDSWESNDDEMDYNEEIKEGFWKSLFGGLDNNAEKFGFAGTCILGLPGMIVGGIVGGITDFFTKLFRGY